MENRIITDHEDYIQDVAFDYYGNMMATCSNDRKIIIYERNDKGEYVYKNTIEAHESPVWKIQWAHPEFGIILASCGFDKCVKIWQYIERKDENNNATWTQRTKILDFSDSIEDISFCPKVYGLKLATCTFNGKLKIFEPSDFASNLNWNCISSKDVSVVGCSAVCWNPSLVDPQSLVVGSYYDSKKQNKESLIQIFVYADSKKEYIFLTYLKSENGHKDSITDIEWCNQFGRTFHLIASCSIDGTMKIWRLDFTYNNNNDGFDNFNIKYEIIHNFSSQHSIWRLSWNLSGTLISCIDDIGKTSLFKKVSDKEFIEINNWESS